MPETLATRGDARFPKSERLRHRADFVRVQSKGERFGTPRLLVVWTPAAAERRRFGVTVSKKVGNSPTRAKVKRWLREIYRQHKPAWPSDIDLVVIARPPAARSDYQTLRADLLRWAERQSREQP